jgi:hypothetical protein
MWQDEKVGSLSRDARLLLVGLITMADDEGRLRAMTAAVLGHVFPYDEDAARKLNRWITEIVGAGIVVQYEVAGKPYIAFRHWRRHQRVNRATPSELPPPPDPIVEADNMVPAKDPNSVNDHGARTDLDVSDHGAINAGSLRAA